MVNYASKEPGPWPVPVMDSAGFGGTVVQYHPLALPFPAERLTGAQHALLNQDEGSAYLAWVTEVADDRARWFLDLLPAVGAPVGGLPGNPAALAALTEWMRRWIWETYKAWRGGPWAVGPGGRPEGLFRPPGVRGGAVSERAAEADATLMSMAHDLAFVVAATARHRRPELTWVLSGAPGGPPVVSGQPSLRLWLPALFPVSLQVLPISATATYLAGLLTDPRADPRRTGASVADHAAEEWWGAQARRQVDRWHQWLSRLYFTLVDGLPMDGPGSYGWRPWDPLPIPRPGPVSPRTLASEPPPRAFFQAVGDYRRAGWFAAESARSDEELAIWVYQRLLDTGGSDLSKWAGRTESEACLVAADQDRTWIDDIEADAGPGNQVYQIVLEALAARSGGALAPSAVHEDWTTTPGKVVVSFRQGGVENSLELENRGDFLDPGIVTGVNDLLAVDGPRFWFVDTGGQQAVVTRATQAEKDLLQALRPLKLDAAPPRWWAEAGRS